MQDSICVNHLDPEQHKLQEKPGARRRWTEGKQHVDTGYSNNLKLKTKKQTTKTKPQNTHTHTK